MAAGTESVEITQHDAENMTSFHDPDDRTLWTVIKLKPLAKHFFAIKDFLDYRKKFDLDAALLPRGKPVYLLGPTYDDYGREGLMLDLRIRVVSDTALKKWTHSF